jgi:ATP-dependent RNA helicase DDX54/DBP10
MDQDERSSSLAGFARGAVRVLFVTDVASRGLDVEGLDIVVNYDFPPRPKIFLHRSGRAGRAGHRGDVVSFVCQDEIPYFVGCKEGLKGEGWILQRVSREEIEDEITQVDDAIKRSTDLENLKKSMENGEKMYVKSRPAAKPIWLTMAKELEVVAGSGKNEEDLLRWRPTQTIFEQATSSQKQIEIMKNVREAHEGHIKSALKSMAGGEPTSVREKPMLVPKSAPLKEQSFKSKFFLDPMQEDPTKIRDVNVSSLKDRVMDMTPEDSSGLLLQKQTKAWGKKSKKQKLIEAMVSGKQALIRNAVAQMEGVNPQGEKYKSWVGQSRKHIQPAGQEEKIVKGKQGKRMEKKWKVKSELKTPEQIERERAAKEKRIARGGNRREHGESHKKGFNHGGKEKGKKGRK